MHEGSSFYSVANAYLVCTLRSRWNTSDGRLFVASLWSCAVVFDNRSITRVAFLLSRRLHARLEVFSLAVRILGPNLLRHLYVRALLLVPDGKDLVDLFELECGSLDEEYIDDTVPDGQP